MLEGSTGWKERGEGGRGGKKGKVDGDSRIDVERMVK